MSLKLLPTVTGSAPPPRYRVLNAFATPRCSSSSSSLKARTASIGSAGRSGPAARAQRQTSCWLPHFPLVHPLLLAHAATARHIAILVTINSHIVAFEQMAAAAGVG